jgi:thioredoxin-related protein
MKNMKRLSVIALLLFSLTAFAGNGPGEGENKKNKIEWLTIEEAQQRAKTEPRKVFVDVYTDWCGWCKRMDKTTFQDEQVVSYVNENFYAVKLDAEGSKKVTFNGQEFTEQSLARAMRVSSFPTLIFFTADFQTFQPVPGYRKADEFRKMLEMFEQAEARPAN